MAQSDPSHGTRAGYKRGCKCPACMAANYAYIRAWRQSRRERGLPSRYEQDHPELYLSADTFDDWVLAYRAGAIA